MTDVYLNFKMQSPTCIYVIAIKHTQAYDSKHTYIATLYTEPPDPPVLVPRLEGPPIACNFNDPQRYLTCTTDDCI